jgi:hypothetical protein
MELLAQKIQEVAVAVQLLVALPQQAALESSSSNTSPSPIIKSSNPLEHGSARQELLRSSIS